MQYNSNTPRVPNAPPSQDRCKWCDGLIRLLNPSGRCDHLRWPENLSDDALKANGYVKVRPFYTSSSFGD